MWTGLFSGTSLSPPFLQRHFRVLLHCCCLILGAKRAETPLGIPTQHLVRQPLRVHGLWHVPLLLSLPPSPISVSTFLFLIPVMVLSDIQSVKLLSFLFASLSLIQEKDELSVIFFCIYLGFQHPDPLLFLSCRAEHVSSL